MNTPQYLLDLFDLELRRIHENLLRRVAKKYNLSADELIEEMLSKPPQPVVSKTEVSLRIYKTVPRSSAVVKDRCIARVWNRGKGGQCTRKKIEDCEYCFQHQKDRKHGDMNEPPNKTIFPNKVKAIYKGV